MEDYRLVLYPYIAGSNGYERKLADRHWVELGQILRSIHTLALPAEFTSQIQRETWSPKWRRMAERYLNLALNGGFEDPAAADLAGFLYAKRAQILDLVRRADHLAKVLQDKSLDIVVCHADIHAGNVLIAPDEQLYVIDWDEIILAPKERDLMYAGGCQFLDHRTPQEEERLFYRGYGQTGVDLDALACYRSERIVQDIAIICQQIFERTISGEDTVQALHYLKSNFQPDGTLAAALQTAQTKQ